MSRQLSTPCGAQTFGWLIGASLCSLLISGCSFSGYGGTTQFKCAAPEGVSCNSISGNYANAVAGTLGQASTIERDAGQAYFDGAGRPSRYAQGSRATPSSGTPIRTQTEVLRIWVAPYQDTDGDLIDQSYTYVTLNEGRWLIEHNQAQIIQEFQPTSLLPMGKASKSPTSGAGAIQPPAANQMKNPMAGLGISAPVDAPPLPPAGTIK